MTVALHAGEGGAQQGFPGSIYPVNNSGCSKLLVIRTPLVVGHGVSVICGSDQLFIGGARHQVACQLLC